MILQDLGAYDAMSWFFLIRGTEKENKEFRTSHFSKTKKLIKQALNSMNHHTKVITSMYSLSRHGKHLINSIAASRLRGHKSTAKILTMCTAVVRYSR
jgi:hypothetical protein